VGYAPHGGFQGRSRPNGEIAWVIHDGLQRPASVAHYPPPAGAAAHVVWVYGYNPAGQLASAWRSNDDFAWTGHYAVERAYGTNGLNQYAYAGPASFSYDPNGNLMWDGGGGRGLVYDVENRLAGSGNVALRYDPLGRLHQILVNRVITLLFSALLLSSCQPNRPETREYFQRMTGIALCEDARIENVDLGEASRDVGTGFIYAVDLTLSPACQEAFIHAMEQRRDPPEGGPDAAGPRRADDRDANGRQAALRLCWVRLIEEKCRITVTGLRRQCLD